MGVVQPVPADVSTLLDLPERRPTVTQAAAVQSLTKAFDQADVGTERAGQQVRLRLVLDQSSASIPLRGAPSAPSPRPTGS